MQDAIFPREELFLPQEESDHRRLKVMTEQIGNASGKAQGWGEVTLNLHHSTTAGSKEPGAGFQEAVR